MFSWFCNSCSADLVFDISIYKLSIIRFLIKTTKKKKQNRTEQKIEGDCLLQGIEKKTAKLKGSEKAVVARHEAGHAVVGTAVANLLTGQPRVEVIKPFLV